MCFRRTFTQDRISTNSNMSAAGGCWISYDEPSEVPLSHGRWPRPRRRPRPMSHGTGEQSPEVRPKTAEKSKNFPKLLKNPGKSKFSISDFRKFSRKNQKFPISNSHFFAKKMKFSTSKKIEIFRDFLRFFGNFLLFEKMSHLPQK